MVDGEVKSLRFKVEQLEDRVTELERVNAEFRAHGEVVLAKCMLTMAAVNALVEAQKNVRG